MTRPNIDFDYNFAAEPREATVERIDTMVQQLLRIEVEQELVRTSELGRLDDFSSCRDSLHRSFSLLVQLVDADVRRLSNRALIRLGESIQAFGHAADALQRYGPGQVNKEVRIQKVEAAEDALADALAAAMPYLRSSASTDPQAVNQLLRQQIEEAEESLSQIRAIVEDVRRASAGGGVDLHVPLFDEVAERYAAHAQRWLASAIGLGVLTVALILVFWAFGHDPDQKTSEAVFTTSLRVALLAVPALGMAFSVRSYGAARHNEIVNEHRANALRTFQTFVNGASDQSIHDAVLLEATHAVFAGQASGWLAGDSADLPAASLILEAIRHSRS